mgnify:CR=1 FL=1
MNANNKIRVLLVDDHQLLRQSLRHALESQGFVIAAEATDGEEGIRLAEQTRPDVILMDVTMPVLDGIEATRRLHSSHPNIPVVILTMHDEPDLVARAVGSGAVGYLVKDCSITELAETVRLAAAGEAALSPQLAAAMLTQTGPNDGDPDHCAEGQSILTRREEEVLQLFALGSSTSEVADELFISAKTVKNHLQSIYKKLDARGRTEAILRAARMGIIRLD